jgi:hypothetical protein
MKSRFATSGARQAVSAPETRELTHGTRQTALKTTAAF